MSAEPGTTAERIRQAAVHMFAESGYEGASLSEIAKAVGIKTPSIYAHYKSKEQLFCQLIQDVIAEERQQYEELLQSFTQRNVEGQLQRLFDFYTDLDNLTSGQAFIKRTMLVPPRHLRDWLRQVFSSYELELNEGLLRVWRQGVEEGLFAKQDEARMIAIFYVCVDGLLVERQIYNDELFNERKRLVWASLWELLKITARED